jgi:hypothetical protein
MDEDYFNAPDGTQCPPMEYSDDDFGNGYLDDDVDIGGDFLDDYWCNNEYTEYDDTGVHWERLSLGKTTLHVCSTGVVRREGDPFWCVTKGVPLTGTPYSYVMVETEPHVHRRFFLHHLVWKAFHGDVPPQWEVRHKSTVPMEYTREYPNDLSLLDIYPVSRPILATD